MSNITAHRGFTPQTMTEAMEFSERLARSQMVPRNYQGKPEDILVAVQWGYEIGLAPIQALQNISVINGKPSVYGDAAMALVQASPVCEGVEEYFEGEGTPNPIAVCIAHRKGRKPVTCKFSVEDAKRAGLWGKQGPWQAYPKRMLQMRARGFALRDAFPDVLKGLITVEEAEDYPEEAKPRPVKDITPANPLDAIAPPKIIEEIYEEEEGPTTIETIEAEHVSAAQQTNSEDTRQEIVDTPQEEAQQTPADDSSREGDSSTWTLFIPGKDSIDTGSLDNWLIQYNDLADKVAKAGRAAPRSRMTKLRELREANETTISKVPTMARVILTQGYQTRLKHLGAIMREEEGTTDSVRADNGPQRQT
jgi:hypothetical protein